MIRLIDAHNHGSPGEGWDTSAGQGDAYSPQIRPLPLQGSGRDRGEWGVEAASKVTHATHNRLDCIVGRGASSAHIVVPEATSIAVVFSGTIVRVIGVIVLVGRREIHVVLCRGGGGGAEARHDIFALGHPRRITHNP